jgi:hypothetical protein
MPKTSSSENAEAPRVSNNQSPTRIVDRWNAPLPPTTLSRAANKFPNNLTPAPSPLRPTCPSTDRLRLWKPLQPFTNAIPHSSLPNEEERERIKDLLTNAWRESTRASYATGLLTYHVFCDEKGIDEVARAPASTDLIISFISAAAGSLAGSTINNYVCGIRTWHIIHHVKWDIDHLAVDTALRAATVSAPLKSSKPPRQPATVDYLCAVLSHLDKNNPVDAAIAACLTTTFWSVSRLGEFTVPTLRAFTGTLYTTMGDTDLDQDRNEYQVRKFRLPYTKSSREQGESTSWARQTGPADPWQAFENHRRVNDPPPGAHVFAYKTARKKILTPLTKRKVAERVKSITTTHNLPSFEGHGLRIGGTLEYLLRGIPFDVVRSMGRWQSDAFEVYLRKHAQILAPYLQANPSQNREFVRLSMPPPR